MPVLATDGLTVRFGGVTAVDNVSIAVESGSLTGLIGPNGAGKTTFIDGVTGLVRSKGTIEFRDEPITKWPTHKRARAGIGRTFQALELFDEFTIEENLLIPAESGRRLSFLGDLIRPSTQVAAKQRVQEALARLSIGNLAQAYPSELSLGSRKLVSIARALASGATFLMLDEPAAGLNSEESRQLGATLREIVKANLTVLLVDHDMGLVLSFCDWVHVLDFGRLIASGSPEEIRRNERVVEAYLGDHEDAKAEVATAP